MRNKKQEQELGISSALAQKSDSVETLVVSTASRVLTPVEQRYTTRNQELSAVLYTLQKFRIYAVGHPITVYSDNKALSFFEAVQLNATPGMRLIIQTL
jgi:hypothetical protein